MLSEVLELLVVLRTLLVGRAHVAICAKPRVPLRMMDHGIRVASLAAIMLGAGSHLELHVLRWWRLLIQDEGLLGSAEVVGFTDLGADLVGLRSLQDVKSLRTCSRRRVSREVIASEILS